MADQGRPNAMPAGREVAYQMTVQTGAPPEAVYDLLADVRSHLEWAGNRGKKNFRLTAIEVHDVPAVKGTEWTSTGVAPDGTFRDRSVVTEATRPTAFEFETNAHITSRKGREADWGVVNRYEIAPTGNGSLVTYTQRVTSATDLGSMKMLLTPVLSSIGRMMVKGLNKPAMRSLAVMAEERARM